tara:strand:- start:62 stop:586 length:525 start_codon:yes stop_codon:yes gene_type:complete
MMHNVRVEQINEKVQECSENSDAATIEFNLEGEWRVSNQERQFGGSLSFPQGELELNADFPPFLGGEGRAPSALAYCFYGAMSCYGSTFATQAAMAGIALDEMKISLRLSVDFRGALGIGSFPPLSGFQFDVKVKSSASNDKVQMVKKLTDERCPAIWAMKNPVPFATSVEKIN